MKNLTSFLIAISFMVSFFGFSQCPVEDDEPVSLLKVSQGQLPNKFSNIFSEWNDKEDISDIEKKLINSLKSIKPIIDKNEMIGNLEVQRVHDQLAFVLANYVGVNQANEQPDDVKDVLVAIKGVANSNIDIHQRTWLSYLEEELDKLDSIVEPELLENLELCLSGFADQFPQFDSVRVKDLRQKMQLLASKIAGSQGVTEHQIHENLEDTTSQNSSWVYFLITSIALVALFLYIKRTLKKINDDFDENRNYLSGEVAQIRQQINQIENQVRVDKRLPTSVDEAPLTILRKELEQLSEKVEVLGKDYHKQNVKSDNNFNDDSPAISEKKANSSNEIVKYFQAPDQDGRFKEKNLTGKETEAYYKLELASRDADHGEISLNDRNKQAMKRIVSQSSLWIYPVCEILNPEVGSGTPTTYIPGIARKKGDKWVVHEHEKIKMRYEI
ncbi:MAG: hypothetical protein AAGA64_06390 [Bacteroidota bacterium]